MSRWYRRYVGTVSDPKIAEAAMVAGCSKSIVIATWDMILESAAEANDGGAFKATSRNVAATLGEQHATVESIFSALEALEMIASGVVTAWSRRQFQSDSSTERSRKHRALKRCNGDATLQGRSATPPDTDTDTDTDTEEEKISPSEFVAAREAADGPSNEISGLNGSTGTIVAGIAMFLNCNAPDYETAKRVVTSNVGIYGADAVRDGYAELMADVDDNKVRVPSVKALVGYFKTASTRKAKGSIKPPGKPTLADVLAKRKAAEEAAA
jgi:hypothetical protein